MTESYDKKSEAAKEKVEEDFIKHFTTGGGGSVWTIDQGCSSCNTKKENKPMQYCCKCKTAMYCNRDCQVAGWPNHRKECHVISTFLNPELCCPENDVESSIEEALEQLGWSSSCKIVSDEKHEKVLKSLRMDGSNPVGGWFATTTMSELSPRDDIRLQKVLVKLYCLLKEEEAWKRDCDTFPRSSYTFNKDIVHVHPQQSSAIAHFIKANGHLAVFTAWLQDPQPPAIQALPFEKRDTMGLLDTLLQIGQIRDAIDEFMTTMFSSS